jgi:hypothetical protein
VEFFEELFSRLPEGFQIRYLRADSGFLSVNFLEALEAKRVPYLIAMKNSASLLTHCGGITTWVPADDGRQEIGEFRYHPSQWEQPRRVVVVRRRQPSSKDGQLTLPQTTLYEYSGIVTNDETLSLQEAVDLYRGRGDCENRIKELKNDYNITGFCLQSFTGTEIAFRLICFLHNLVSAFRRMILRDSTLTLGTIRARVFVVGAQLGTSARKVILRLGLTRKWREAYEVLLKRIDPSSLSTAPQLSNYLNSNAYQAPTPWKKRPMTWFPTT